MAMVLLALQTGGATILHVKPGGRSRYRTLRNALQYQGAVVSCTSRRGGVDSDQLETTVLFFRDRV
jgi:hypothetical protein